MIKVSNANTLIADIPRSDAILECQYRGGKDSCTCSYYAGDDAKSKNQVKQFMANCQKMFIDLNSVQETIKQLDTILDSYIHVFKGTINEYKKARNYFLIKKSNIEITKFSTTGERGYYAFDNKEEAIIEFRRLLFTKITNFEIISDSTVYYVKLKIADNWRSEIMKIKMVKDDLIRTYNDFMNSSVTRGKNEKSSAVIFGVKYNNIIINSHVSAEELVHESNYNDTDNVDAINLGMSISPEIIWETVDVEDSDKSAEEPQDIIKKYNKDDFLKDVFIDSDEYDSLYNLLKYKRNVILQGAPGVGKTFLAKRLAYSIIGSNNNEQVEMVQFHQNFSYEDFIMGYKPVDNGFELKCGIFYSFCKKAEENLDRPYFFIIDEINRGNLSKIFGELMMLIEGDKRGEKVRLAYKDEEFSVPKNVYLIGMMNTADRSLAMMDYALRRRFSFFDISPAFNSTSFKTYISQNISMDLAERIISNFQKLNKFIEDESTSGLGKGYCIGHSYFCVPPVKGQKEQEWYDSIIKYEIAPLLYEYWWDDQDKAKDCINELIK